MYILSRASEGIFIVVSQFSFNFYVAIKGIIGERIVRKLLTYSVNNIVNLLDVYIISSSLINYKSPD